MQLEMTNDPTKIEDINHRSLIMLLYQKLKPHFLTSQL